MQNSNSMIFLFFSLLFLTIPVTVQKAHCGARILFRTAPRIDDILFPPERAFGHGFLGL